ncbi:MAG: hypothetical protein V3U44_11100 [Alphaproteobacteria bacterium]
MTDPDPQDATNPPGGNQAGSPDGHLATGALAKPVWAPVFPGFSQFSRALAAKAKDWNMVWLGLL